MALSEEEKKILKQAEEIQRKLEQEKHSDEVSKTIREREVKRVLEQQKADQKNEKSVRSSNRSNTADTQSIRSATQKRTEETTPQPRPLEEDIDKVDPDFGEPVKAAASKKQETVKNKKNKIKKTATSTKSNIQKRKKKRKNALLRVCMLLLLLAAVGVTATYLFLTSLASITEYHETAHSGLREEDVYTNSNVKNILLIGTDVEDHDTSRSDAIILASINSKSRTITLTSILRDSYVDIPGYGWNRINASYQYGGADLLMSTIEHNFKVGIDSFVQVDFFSFIDLVDSVGGVEVDVDEGEMNYINGYLNEINALLGLDEASANANYIGTYGEQMHLNGAQALAYSRIRYIGTDFQRTERQREVINAVVSRAKKASPLTWYHMAQIMLPEISTDIEDSDMAALIMKAVFYMNYDMVQFRVPADGTWSDLQADVGSVLQIDFDNNRQQLRSVIYGE